MYVHQGEKRTSSACLIIHLTGFLKLGDEKRDRLSYLRLVKIHYPCKLIEDRKRFEIVRKSLTRSIHITFSTAWALPPA